MTLFLYSEGGRDLGDEEAFLPDAIGGPLRAVIERILGKEGLHIVARPLSHVHGRADQEEPTRGYDMKVFRALRDAQRDDAEAVVVVVDRDGPGGAKRLQQLKAGRARAAVPTPSALGVAQEMVESWLFGDRAAFERAFGAVPEGMPSQPESQTGGRGSPHYAKAWLERALAPFRARDERFVALYTRLAESIDVAVLEATCPSSFKPFAKEVRTNVAPAFQAYR